MNSSLVGEIIDGRYRVHAYIAEGGMATVYLATDTRLDRDVALKVMRPHLAEDEAFVNRFRREARSAARLSHPHVVSVYDQGEDERRVFLAMEYVHGHTLRDIIQHEGALTPRAALDILDPVLQALAAAHAAGYVHRDVKPENVLLRRDGVVKVADFGLARAVSSQSTSTHTGLILGTVAYLSPEQVERGVADVRSDVYSAGLLLFEMLTGRKAFPGEVPIHVAYQHVHEDVTPPSHVLSGIPPQLDALVMRATARNPAERPADAAAFLEELRRTRATLSEADLDDRPTGAAVPVAAAVPTRTTALPRNGSGDDGAEATTVLAPARSGDAGPGNEPSRGTRLARVLVPLLILAATGLVAWYFLAGPGSPTTVPKVAGMTYDAASARLSDADLTPSRTDAFSESVAKGEVISADPAAGSSTRRGSTVVLTVSKGPERYAVPNLAGMARAKAQEAISAQKLTVGTVSREYSDTVSKGVVISSDPTAGTKLKRGASVDLVVSKGPQPISLPDVVGMREKEAEKTLTDLGLKVEKGEDVFSSTVPKKRVAVQQPAQGQSVFPGDTVTLQISKGPQMVKVPDVQSKQEAEARQILESAGLKVQVRKVLGGFFGTVRQQDPRPGSEVPIGTTVTIVIV